MTKSELDALKRLKTEQLEGPWVEEAIESIADGVISEVQDDPALLMEKWETDDPCEAADLEIEEKVRALPKSPKVRIGPDDWQAETRRRHVERRATIAERRRENRRAPSPSRSRGRARRTSSNARRRGSKRTATTGGSRGDPDGDPDPSDPDGRGGREPEGRYCLGCGAEIGPERRSDAVFCPRPRDSRCRKRYIRSGEVAAPPLIPEPVEADREGRDRSPFESRDRYLYVSDLRQAIRSEPNFGDRFARDLGPVLDQVHRSAEDDYRRDRAAVVGGRVAL